MFINLEKPTQGPYYALYDWTSEGGKERIVNYGKQKPTFSYPRLHNGLAENYLPDIADGEVGLLDSGSTAKVG